jgi:hypothetical protein
MLGIKLVTLIKSFFQFYPWFLQNTEASSHPTECEIVNFVLFPSLSSVICSNALVGFDCLWNFNTLSSMLGFNL